MRILTRKRERELARQRWLTLQWILSIVFVAGLVCGILIAGRLGNE